MIDVLMIFETKAHSCFLSAQFHLGDCASPYRLRRNPNAGNVLLYIRERITSALLIFELSMKKKCLFFCSHNSKKNLIAHHS